jgi:hypothetical protein
MRKSSRLLVGTLLALALGAPISTPTRTAHAEEAKKSSYTPEQLLGFIKTVDERQRNSGDYRSEAYIEQKEKGKVAVVYEAVIYRRSQDQRFIILFTKPKSSQGQGYLRVDKNLWFYDPAVGKWERRTERERIGGTNSRRSDFDESRLA